jgi:hypothetical protein
MNSWNWVGLLASGAIVAMAACSDDPATGDDGEGGSGGSTPTTVSTTGGNMVTTSTTGGGGMMPGNGICGSPLSIDGAVIDGCLTANCCASFDPCLADAACQACLQSGPMGPGCDTNTLYQAFTTCQDGSCPVTLCDSDLGYGSPNLNLCLNESCCTEFSACEADMMCNTCLTSMDPEAMGCDQIALWTTYDTCRNTNCPDDICGSGILYVTTYESNMSQDVAYDTNLCAGTNCCTEITDCADPSMDGVMEMNDPEVDECLGCLTNMANCPGGAVEAAADAFEACVMTNMCNQ